MQHTEAPPRFLINPMAAKRSMWFPKVFQMAIGAWPNPSYANSVWLGAIYNPLTLPIRVLTETVFSLLKFDFYKALASVFVIPLSFVLFLILGLSGRLLAVPITLEQGADGLVLDHGQCQKLLEMGNTDLVTDLQAT